MHELRELLVDSIMSYITKKVEAQHDDCSTVCSDDYYSSLRCIVMSIVNNKKWQESNLSKMTNKLCKYTVSTAKDKLPLTDVTLCEDQKQYIIGLLLNELRSKYPMFISTYTMIDKYLIREYTTGKRLSDCTFDYQDAMNIYSILYLALRAAKKYKLQGITADDIVVTELVEPIAIYDEINDKYIMSKYLPRIVDYHSSSIDLGGITIGECYPEYYSEKCLYSHLFPGCKLPCFDSLEVEYTEATIRSEGSEQGERDVCECERKKHDLDKFNLDSLMDDILSIINISTIKQYHEVDTEMHRTKSLMLKEKLLNKLNAFDLQGELFREGVYYTDLAIDIDQKLSELYIPLQEADEKDIKLFEQYKLEYSKVKDWLSYSREYFGCNMNMCELERLVDLKIEKLQRRVDFST